MSEYRNKVTGEVKSQGEWRKHYRNVSLPKVWTTSTLAALKLDPILKAPKPDHGPYQTAVRNGVCQDAKSNWIECWEVKEMFDTPEQIAEYQADLDAKTADSVRTTRSRLIAETDFHALTDVVMSPEMAAYRQALRDVTVQEGFPHDINWPVKPE